MPLKKRWWWLLIAAQACGGQDLAGVIDLHVHCDPDSMARSIDGISLARLARSRGMRGLVLKNHNESTAGLAYLAEQAAPGLEVFGGIALNRAVGGVNLAALDHMVRLKGGRGRVVWMPTFDAENQVRSAGEQRPFVPIARDGRLLPAVREVLAFVAKHDLTLATGHSSAAETLLLIEEARRAGVRRIVATHATAPPVSMSVEQLRRAAGMGAWIEFVYNAVTGPNKIMEIGAYTKSIRAVSPAHAIVCSDFGQAANPLPPDGMAAFLKALRAEGFTPAEIDRMSKTNPAAALGLQP